MNNEPVITGTAFLTDVKQIIDAARSSAARSIDFCRVQMYWNIGRRIFEEEQQGKVRADYGTYLIKNLAQTLEPEYGSGFSYRQLAFCRQFYRLYPIANALRSQLNWTQYRMLIQIDDPDKREYYELESVNNGWTARETERQINSQLYERLLLSSDKEAVISVAHKERLPQTSQEIIKDPRMLKFLGLERKAAYYGFPAFRRYEILTDKGNVSRQAALKRAESEYDAFNKTQKITSDFDQAAKQMLKGDDIK